MSRADEGSLPCPRCGGGGKDLAAGQLVTCDGCDGSGRVPAILIRDMFGAACFGHERWPAFLEPIPKAYRTDDH